MTIATGLRDEMRDRLAGEKQRLEDELSRFAKPTEVEGDYETAHEEIGREWEENATETEMYADNVALEERLEMELSEVSKAMERLKDGIYGVCRVCGKDIEEGRLRAYPAADDCMEHAK